jgi:pilus assembly protein CpaE
VLTVNLAVELSQFAGGPVALVDLDYRFGQVATLLDVDPTYTLADLCHSPEQLEPSVIQRALVRHESGVYVLSRPATFAQADTITAAACAGLLAVLQQTHEFVVTDGPVRFDPASRAVLDVADSALLVLQLLVPQVRNAVRIIEEMRANGYNTSRIKLVCNRVGRDTGQLSEKDAAETLGLAPFAVVPEDWAAVSGAVNLGEPLAQHGPKSKARLAIREIARRLHQPDDATDDRSTRNKGLIRRIFAAGAHA